LLKPLPFLLALLLLAVGLAAELRAQAPATTQAAIATSRPAVDELAGRNIEDVRILGRNRPLSGATVADIRHQVRSREGSKFDPETVREDYQRVFGLQKFSNVEARVEPTAAGVIVVFEVSEQDQVRSIAFKGNQAISDEDLRALLDVRVGQAIDNFRLTAAREAMERLYRTKNFPYAHVNVLPEPLAKEGAVVFQVVEGPRVTIRKVEFTGNRFFSDTQLDKQVKTDSWFLILRSGTFDAQQVDQDVATLRQYYEDHGFFDARVGRKLTFSADQTDMKVTFVIEEGQRYVVNRITFKGNHSIPDSQLRPGLRMAEGRPFDRETIQKDVRHIIHAYSPLGFIYYSSPGTPPNPDYLQVSPRTVFHKDAGKVDLIYDINEGKPFQVGRTLVKGNQKTQDKVVLRELRQTPGELFNTGELQDAQERLRGTNFFSDVRITPIGNEPTRRDVLVEVTEQSTSRVLFGAGVTSSSGLLGNISYEQKNFDISAWPTGWSDIAEGRAFTGAGQFFRVNLEPGTQLTRASIDFVEPWVFDQPYSAGGSAFLSQRLRENYSEGRAGGRLFVSKRFQPYWTVKLTFRGEDVLIKDIDEEFNRAADILDLAGHNTLTSVALEVRRDTTDSPLLPSRGSILAGGIEIGGALGGKFDYQRFTFSWDQFQTLGQDVMDRKTILRAHADAGYLAGDPPFFERFYGGDRSGLGALRGFRFRGISPRQGPAEDPVGGNFLLMGGLELSFPLYSDSLRGVIFSDVGTVEDGVGITTLRSSVGFGFRMTLPFLGPVPLAFDFGIPITKSDQDDLRFFSFSMGLIQ